MWSGYILWEKNLFSTKVKELNIQVRKQTNKNTAPGININSTKS